MPVDLSVKDILKATDGVLLQGNISARVKDVCIDSRKFRPGAMFIAIAGHNFDGHDFIGDVAAMACGAVVSRPDIVLPKNKPVIYVKDTTQALGKIAWTHRMKFRIPVVAITGSSGKTTTKDLVAAVLNRKYRVLYNAGTQNNHIGVPLTLLNLHRRHQVAVLELGTNRFGDIAWLTSISYPTIAVFTTIGESHLECLRTPQGVFKEKTDLIRFMHPYGKVIVNQDNVFLAKVKKMFPKKKVVTFGIHKSADLGAERTALVDNQRLEFYLKNGERFSLNTAVQENVYNALAAVACGKLLGVSYQESAKALKACAFPKGRQAVKQVNRYWIIDDTYNANPVSLRSAVNTLAHLQVPGRRILVCADMLELGDKSRQLHRMAGNDILRSNVDLVLTFGRWSKEISDSIRSKAKGQYAFHCKDINALHRKLKQYCRAGDAVLVKGSRGMHMERTVEYLNEKIFSKN